MSAAATQPQPPEPTPAAGGRAAPTGWQTTAAADGTRLAWRVDGPASGLDRGPAVVCCNGIACSDHYWTEVVPSLAAVRPVVRWDYRGHGRSGAPADRDLVGVDAVVDDLVAVLDAAEVDQAVLVGHSYGVQIALEGFRRLGRDRVAGLVAVAGTPGAPLQRFGMEPGALLFPVAAAVATTAPVTTARLWRRLWGSPAMPWIARAVRGTTAAAPRPVLNDYFTHVGGLDLDLMVRMFASMEAHSAVDVLDDLPVPLLAVAGDADGLTPVSVMRDLALAAPDGELVVVHGASHTLPAEHPRRLAAEIDAFVDRL